MILFAHANGFPASCYEYFFACLQPHEIRSIERLGMGKFPASNNWKLLADELIEFIESEMEAPVTGIGHSLGGVAVVFAARKRPELFERLIIMDPPFFHPSRSWLIPILNLLGQGHRIPIAGKALRRREHFESREEARAYLSEKRLFRPFHPECFESYIQHGLREDSQHGGFTLSIPKSIEAAFFMNTPGIGPVTRLGFPTHLLFSESGEVLRPQDVRWLRRRLPETAFRAVEGGHMFPLERPEETAEIIRSLMTV